MIRATLDQSPDITLLELVDQVDAEQLRVLWIAANEHACQELVRDLQQHVMATRTVSRRKVRVGAYREAYEHADGGRILFTWPSRNLHWIRGHSIDAIVGDANPADWPRHFLLDLHVLVEGLGARILRTERARY